MFRIDTRVIGPGKATITFQGALRTEAIRELHKELCTWHDKGIGHFVLDVSGAGHVGEEAAMELAQWHAGDQTTSYTVELVGVSPFLRALIQNGRDPGQHTSIV